MTRTTLVLAVVGAFVLGSIATGTMTYAAPGGSGDNLIADAINALTTAVEGIDPNVNVSPTPITNEINVDPTPITVNVDTPENGRVISFSPLGTIDGVLKGDTTRHHAILLYGDTFCGVDLSIRSQVIANLYIEFATTMTVEHDSSLCSGANWKIKLDGNEDSVFQPGDVLILRFVDGDSNYGEVYREQTI